MESLPVGAITVDNLGKPTFVDTRWDHFEHLGIMKDYIDIASCRDSLDLLNRYRIDHALLKKDSPLAYLLEHTTGWSIEQKEGVGGNQYVLFERSHH